MCHWRLARVLSFRLNLLKYHTISIPTHSVTFASPETFKEYFFSIANSWFYAFTLKTASSYCAEWKGWCWIIYTRDLKTLRTLYFVSSSCDFRTTVEGMER